MADPFETRLDALYGDAAEPVDAAFLLAVEARLAARRARRRIATAACAGAAALAGTAVAVATGLSQAFADLLASAGTRAGALLPQLGPPALQAGVGWSLVGLVALGLAWAGNRLVEAA